MIKYLCLALLFAIATPFLGAQEYELTDLYLLEVRGRMPRSLARIVEKAGGTLIQTIPEIGRAVAHSEDPDFGPRIERYRKITRCTRDYSLQWIPRSPDLAR